MIIKEHNRYSISLAFLSCIIALLGIVASIFGVSGIIFGPIVTAVGIIFMAAAIKLSKDINYNVDNAGPEFYKRMENNRLQNMVGVGGFLLSGAFLVLIRNLSLTADSRLYLIIGTSAICLSSLLRCWFVGRERARLIKKFGVRE
ncbi:hypothetical protein AEAC466_19160 [Asticcacaulis sp. AC466]|nr:hypothetical protein AEAC466_19160 [Asticcacaulis sp. AC466]